MEDRVHWFVWCAALVASLATSCAGDEVVNVLKTINDTELLNIKSCILNIKSETIESKSNRTVQEVFVNNDYYSKNGLFDVLGLWDSFPKVITPRSGSEKCRNESGLFLKSLADFELWALKMFDATAKLPSGILSGNINQYGDFDECLSVDDAVQGKYCLASVQLTHSLAHIDSLLHAHNYIRSNITDIGHRVPKFSSILWGICIPSSCSSQELEDELRQRLERTGAQVRVQSSMCSTKDKRMEPSFGKTIATVYFLLILALLTLGTLFDNGSEGGSVFNKLLNAFSLRRNFKKLIDISEAPNQVSAVNGVRFLNALALMMAHKSMAMTHMPFVNRTAMSESLAEPWTVIGRTAIIYTDSFLYLSGMLNAHQLLQELHKKGTIDFKSRLISRWFRLFPLFLSLMLFCTYVMPDINNGPQWNLVVEEHSRVCKQNMWKSFLFIHNFFGFENMCLTHTHQLGLDMQLYLVTPLFVWMLWRVPKLGWFLLLGSGMVSTVLRYLAVYSHNISMVVYFGISVQNLMDAAKYSYVLPYHRATIYLFGVGMAYFLLSKHSKFQLSKIQTYVLWTTALAFGLWSQLSPWRMGLREYTFEHGPAAVYAAISPVLWGCWLSMAHWAVSTGHGGCFTDFLNSRVFRLFNKISYGVYLTQFPLFFYNVGVQRQADYYSIIKVLYLPEIVTILALSVLTTLAIEMPFNEIHRKFFSKQKAKHEKIKDT